MIAKTSEWVQQNHKKLFPIFLIILIVISCQGRNDTDFYFLYENGKKVLGDGFPYYDWISMHDGLHIVMQQWIISIVDFLVYSNFGVIGLCILIACVFTLAGFIIYKVCLLKSNNYLLSYLVTIFALMILMFVTGSPRPVIYSVIFVSLSTYCLEKFNKTKNTKYLLFLPLFSLLQSNCHSTFWLAVIGTIFVYFASFTLVNRIRKEDFKPLLFIWVIFAATVVVGFINPYGYEAVFQAFYTLGYDEYKGIAEMQPINSGYLLVMMLIPLTIYLLNLRLNKNTVNSSVVASLFLLVFTMFATIFALRVIVFAIVMWAFAMSDVPKFKLQSLTTEEKIPKKEKIELSIVCFAIALMGVFTLTHSITDFDRAIRPAEEYKQTLEFLQKDGAKANQTLFSTDVTEGQYFYHYLGMRPYIDGRLETYIKSLNKKADILSERKEMAYGKGLDKFLDKYKFDYLMIREDQPTQYLLEYNDDYNLVFYSGEDNNRKDVGNSYRVYKRNN